MAGFYCVIFNVSKYWFPHPLFLWIYPFSNKRLSSSMYHCTFWLLECSWKLSEKQCLKMIYCSQIIWYRVRKITIYYDRHTYRHIFIIMRLMNDESTVGILLFITCYWKSLCFFSSGFPFTRISLLFWHICTDQLCWVCNMGKHIIYIWIENSLFARLW